MFVRIYLGVINLPEIKILAQKVKKIRREMRESQIVFAANCGISTEILSLIENERSNPRLSTMQKIAAHTNYTVSELLKNESKRLNDMKYLYQVNTNVIINDKNKNAFYTYGVDVLYKKETILSIPNISDSYSMVYQLVKKCNVYGLDVIHITDVIEDTLKAAQWY